MGTDWNQDQCRMALLGEDSRFRAYRYPRRASVSTIPASRSRDISQSLFPEPVPRQGARLRRTWS